MLQHSCNAKVSNLYLAVLGHENILSFQIPVQNFPIMNVLDCESNLNKPVENLTFREQFLDFLLILNLFIHVSSIRIIHNDAQELLVHE